MYGSENDISGTAAASATHSTGTSERDRLIGRYEIISSACRSRRLRRDPEESSELQASVTLRTSSIQGPSRRAPKRERSGISASQKAAIAELGISGPMRAGWEDERAPEARAAKATTCEAD